MKKYFITLLHLSGEIESTFQTDYPKTALNKWFTYTRKSPTMANIACGSREDCMALYVEFLKNKDEFFRKYWMSNPCIAIKFEYLLNTCDEYINKGRTLYFSGKKSFYDSVYPFCYG